MSELHIKNHFVPECYLKRWEDSNNKICVYRILVSHSNIPIWRRYTASAIAYHKHLYTQMVSGTESDALEKWLDKKYESPANDALEKAVLEKRLSADDWDLLIKFLAAQDVRTPARLFEHLKRNNEVLSEILQNTLDKLKEKLEKKELVALEKQDRTVKNSDLIPLKLTTKFEPGNSIGILMAESYVGRSTWIYSIKHLLENTEKILHKHKWSIVKPAKGYKWFTSDNPVVKLNYISSNNYDLKGGWGKKKGNIIFPIGPDHAMFVQIGDKPISKGTRLTVRQTREFRKFIAENSHRMIFSNFIDEEIKHIKPRQVDSEKFRKEKIEMETWHELNSKKELEYLKNNQNA